MKILKLYFFWFILAFRCVGQTTPVPPVGPDISAYYRLKVGDVPLYKWLRVDSPLTVTEDAKKTPHLGLAVPFSLDGKVIGNVTGVNVVSGPGVILSAINNSGVVTLQISLMAGCTVDGVGTGVYCPGTSGPLTLPSQATIVTHEMPVQRADGKWTVIGMPTAQGVNCFKSNVYQVPGTDYTLDGNVITATWVVADAVFCQYSYFTLAP